MTGAKFVHSDIDNKIREMQIGDDESCFVLSEVTRVATIKLIGSLSRVGMTERGLTEREIEAVLRLYNVLQT